MTGPTAAATVHPLCRLDELADGHSRGFDPTGEGHDSMFIVRRGDALHAWRNACPHIDGAPMPWRKDAYLSGDRQQIVCYAHGARFEIESGLCVRGPCLGQRLEAVALRVDDEGHVYLASPA